VLLAVGYFSLSRGVHPGVIFMVRSHADLLRAFAPTAAIVLAFLLLFGLLGGWLLAGRMLAPLTRITDATRVAANGSLSHRIELEGRQDEFRELPDAFDTMLVRLEAHIAEQQRFAANASHELHADRLHRHPRELEDFTDLCQRTRRAVCRLVWQLRMEPLWSSVVATGGNQPQVD
jgi:HAMP domain-containing protein